MKKTLFVFFILLFIGGFLYADFQSFKHEAVPILAYHRIYEATDNPYILPPKLFAEQMEYLYNEGYSTLSVADFVRLKADSAEQKRIILTFDDGYKDNLTIAVPIMEKYGFKGTVFPALKFLAWPDYADRDDLLALQKAGWEIGSHTYNHVELGKLKREQVRDEIVFSLSFLQTRFTENRPVTLCYPNGSYNEETCAEIRRAGFVAGLTGDFGVNTAQTVPEKLKRVNVIYNKEYSFKRFKQRLRMAYLVTWLEGKGIDILKWRKFF